MSETNANNKRDWSKVKRNSTRQVNVRLSAEEAAILDEIVTRAGVSASGYMRAATFNRPPPRAVAKVDVDATMLRQILGHLGKLGSNANQIARGVNTGNLSDYRAVWSTLESINRQLAEMRTELLTALRVEP